jgi:hypothetical protein
MSRILRSFSSTPLAAFPPAGCHPDPLRIRELADDLVRRGCAPFDVVEVWPTLFELASASDAARLDAAIEGGITVAFNVVAR